MPACAPGKQQTDTDVFLCTSQLPCSRPCFASLCSQLLSALSHKHCMIRTVTNRMNTSYYLTLWPVASSPKNLPYLMYLFGCIQTMCRNITTFCWAKKYPIFSSSLYFPITSVTHSKYNLEQRTEKVLPCFEITWYSQLSPAKVKSNSSF